MIFDSRIIARLKREADLHPLPIDAKGMPHPRHWADFPGGIRVCFTKWEGSRDNCEPQYHLSISTTSGKPNDEVIEAVLEAFGVHGLIKEFSAQINASVRHFLWSPESMEQEDVENWLQ